MGISGLPSECTQSFDYNDVGIILGVILIVGTLISYLPQIIVLLIWRKTTGLSHLYIALATVFTWTDTLNALLLNYDVMAVCCPISGFWPCNAALISVYQIAVMGPCAFTTYLLFSIFFTPQRNILLETVLSEDNVESKQRGYESLITEANENQVTKTQRMARLFELMDNRIYVRACLGILYFFIILSFLAGYLLIYFYSYSSDAVKYYADVYGYISAIAVTFQISPQIYATWKNKTRGALSVVQQMIQAPGNILVVLLQLLYHQRISTWLPFLLAATQQIVLLCLIAWFDFILPKMKGKGKQEESVIVSQSPEGLNLN